MVYGFVKQSKGHIKIYSEEGHGTSVKLYLPAAATDQEDGRVAIDQSELPGAKPGEVVLVVEDDPMVLRLAIQLLASLGYQTLEAHDGPEAIATLERAGRIDLLFTDVVLPKGINGTALARDAQRRPPATEGALHVGLHRRRNHSSRCSRQRRPYADQAVPQGGARAQGASGAGRRQLIEHTQRPI